MQIFDNIEQVWEEQLEVHWKIYTSLAQGSSILWWYVNRHLSKSWNAVPAQLLPLSSIFLLKYVIFTAKCTKSTQCNSPSLRIPRTCELQEFIFETLKTYTNISEDNDVAHLLYRRCTDKEYVKLLNHKRNKFFSPCFNIFLILFQPLTKSLIIYCWFL